MGVSEGDHGPLDRGGGPVNVLVIEDGFEYTETFSRFLPDGFVWTRAGSGPEALVHLAAAPVDTIVLDLCFDRTPASLLLGGDGRAPADLRRDQGLLVLAALRAAGYQTPVLFAHDFSDTPARWSKIEAAYRPVAQLPDHASPARVASALRALAHADAGPRTR